MDLRETLIDLVTGLLSLALIISYEIWLRLRTNRDPLHSLSAATALARAAWVERIMASGEHIVAIQTLRNSVMTASFLASTSILVVIGLLNMAGQSKGSLAQFWHALNVFPEVHPALWTGKILLIVLVLLASFFCFTIAIRLFNHVGYLIALPGDDPLRSLPPSAVARVLNHAAAYLALGLRAYYLAVPALFWLFGPQFAVVASVVLIVLLARVDLAPRDRSA